MITTSGIPLRRHSWARFGQTSNSMRATTWGRSRSRKRPTIQEKSKGNRTTGCSPPYSSRARSNPVLVVALMTRRIEGESARLKRATNARVALISPTLTPWRRRVGRESSGRIGVFPNLPFQSVRHFPVRRRPNTKTGLDTKAPMA